MDELRQPHNLHLPSASPGRHRSEVRPSRLGSTLRDAREDKGLELRDLAVLTNVRVMHLEALEAGDFRNLPEDVYSKNFVRLYAQAVGLEPSRMLLLYGQERRAAAGASAGAASSARDRELTFPSDTATRSFNNPRLGRALRLLATLLLVVALVLAALWGFNRLMAPGPLEPAAPPRAATLTPAPQATPTEPNATTAAAAPTLSAAPKMILLSVRTTPPGAEVSIDGYPFGQSPIVDAPIRGGQRTVQIERAGYRAFRSVLDLSGDRRLNFTLNPTDGKAPTAAPTTARQITVNVSEEAWLEVYRGGARGEGERLVYVTAQPGDTFTFDVPVYIFSGNAGGVAVARGRADAEVLGSVGAVLGRAY